MKISLEHKEGVAFLNVSGSVEAQQFQVLKAGLSKLLRDGKNRIVVNFTDAQNLGGEVIREIAILDLFARELAGRIIIVSSSAELKESVLSFSKPPVIPFLSTPEQAQEYFKKLKPDEEEGGESVAELKKQLEAKNKEIEALQAQIKLLDPKELQKARLEKSDALAKVKLLEEQVESLFNEKGKPVDAEGFMEKITSLEDNVKRFSQQTAAPAKK